MNPKSTLTYTLRNAEPLIYLKKCLTVALVLLGVFASAELYAGNCCQLTNNSYTVTPNPTLGGFDYVFTFTSTGSNGNSTKAISLTVSCSTGDIFIDDDCFPNDKGDPVDYTITVHKATECAGVITWTWIGRNTSACNSSNSCCDDATTVGSITGGPSPVCQDDPVTLSVSGVLNGSIEWYKRLSPSGTYSLITNETETTLANEIPGPGDNIYDYKVIVVNGCALSETPAFPIEVDATTVASSLLGGMDICISGSTGIMEAAPVYTADFFQWTRTNPDNSVDNVGNGSSLTDNLNGPPPVGIYTYALELKNGVCPSLPALNSIDIEVFALPSGGSVDNGSSPIYENQTTGTMNLTGNGGTVVRWEYYFSDMPITPPTGPGGGWLEIVGTTGLSSYEENPGGNGFGEGYWYYRAYVENEACSAYSDYETIVVLSGILPVSLTDFFAVVKQNIVQLLWRTESEQNNEKFIIENSSDGRAFKSIGEVSGNGTTTEKQEYQFTDKNPVSGINYYRLKQMDFDGSFEYSPIVTVNFKADKGSRILSNPVSDKLTIEFGEASDDGHQILIYNTFGTLVKTFTVEPESSGISVPVFGFVSGHYYVEIRGAHTSETHRWIKL